MIAKDYSYGVLPLRRTSGFWELLLICQRHGGHWGFPKGHANPNEAPKEAAVRELFEETGLQVTRWLEIPPFTETYFFYRSQVKIQKEVTYYVALVDGTLALQEIEIIAAEWVPLNKAVSRVTFPQAEQILIKLNAHLLEASPY